ncbi:hypothetical protein D9Q98_003620 [Chlorella vulgaris]|uniref:RAP domain-containing protein n=1 Tax=Chlorella vulgaris TaxID=3077 RepID=A0A9D4YZ75_CHLVU|nr:hypothetical protein D9Q98_003620 [Chlorella vulgaris]
MGLLQELDAWALVALLRAAAHFASLNADELKAWQAALKTQALERLPAVAVSNALLSLSTLAAGSEALKAALDASLVVRLVQRWLQLLPGMLSIDTCQGLYGAACLGYPFSQQELDRITQQALEVDGTFQALCGAQLFRAWRLLDAAWQEWDSSRQQSAVAAASKRQPRAVWPGDEAVKEALRRVLSMELDAKHASQILLALGQLRFQPSAAAIDALVNAYYRFLKRQEQSAIGLTAFLDGCALLGCRLPPKAVESCLEAVVAACASNPSEATRCSSTTAWALAHLQQCDIKAWQQLAGLAAVAPIADWPAVNLRRLYQAYMHAVEVDQRVGPGGRSGEAASDCWEEGWLQVNLAVPSLRLVVQADGPYQYFRNKPGVLLPTTVARDRLLRSWGWHVISVPFTIPEQHLAEYWKQQLAQLR